MFAPLKESILKRAQDKGLIEIEIINFRDFSACPHKKVDDTVYGGGQGMLLACQPIYDALKSIDPGRKAHRVYMCAKGETFTQTKAKELAAKRKHIVLLCGHYEGVDERVLELCFDERISLGQFVLTGGELPAMVLVDAVARMVKGVLTSEECYRNESHYDGFLEEPQYTRPQEFMGKNVPEVLMSGNHKQIEEWRKSNRRKV